MPRELIFSHHRSLGDIVTMTALVRDITLHRPGEFRIDIHTSFKDVWMHNPYLHRHDADSRKRAATYKLTYGAGIRKASKEEIHFLRAWHEDFHKQVGVHIPLLIPKPDLHLSDNEKSVRLVEGRYWVILSGGKMDFTTKHWVYTRYQKVVDSLRKCGLRLVQAGSAAKSPITNYHPPLEGVLSLVGKTNVREFMRLIYQSEGVIGPITAAMHIAAAFDKPCVVLAGGREEPWWEGYHNQGQQFGPIASGKVKVEHRYLHTLGLLDCCKQSSCWKNKTTPQEKDSRNSYCKQPVASESKQVVPLCMEMIRPGHVVEAAMSYYTQGILPPIGPEPIIILPDGEKLGSGVETVPGHQVLSPVSVAAPPPPPPPPTILTPPQGNKAVLPQPGQIVDSVFDTERIGGKFTVFVLLYGDYFDMHQRCINAILSTCPAKRIDLRVGSNALGPRSVHLLESLRAEGKIAVHYLHHGNDLKYPVMRQMFHDPERPIVTKWVVWFDDDSMCDRNKSWLQLLAQFVLHHPDRHFFGPHRFSSLKPNALDWIKAAKWYKGKMFRDRTGKPSPNGNVIHFASGSHWCMSAEAIRVSDIPDERLGLNFGDVINGEALWQNGFLLKDWNGNKQLVNWSSIPQRGKSVQGAVKKGPWDA